MDGVYKAEDGGNNWNSMGLLKAGAIIELHLLFIL